MKNDFEQAVDRVKTLERYDRYLAAFVFGSVARGNATEESDLNVKVITDNENCENVNLLFIKEIRLIITFISFPQLEKQLLDQSTKDERQSLLIDAVILFDKTGRLTQLKKMFKRTKRQKLKKQDHYLARFPVFHAENKISRSMNKKDYLSAQLSLHIDIHDLLKAHYQLQGRWYVSDKHLMADLSKWDKRLFSLLSAYLKESDVPRKYEIWLKLTAYVLKPIGGRQAILDNKCNCSSCRKDVKRLAFS